jgi:VWFA-related protein
MRQFLGLAVFGVGVLGGDPLHAQAVFRGGVDLVNFGVSVVDRNGEPIAGLTAADFELKERGVLQEIRTFAAGEAHAGTQPPLHLGLLLDTSGSMESDLELARTAAIKFLNTLTAAEDMTLVDFDTEVRVARYGQNDFPRLVERIRQRKAAGYTALYDALGVYLDGAASQEGRKILVLYTDGSDTRSSLTHGETLDLLRASDVIVFAIGFLEHQPRDLRLEQRSTLMRLTQLTGGQAFFPTRREDLDGVYERIEREIKAQYTLGYVSTDPKMDGSWREVSIKLLRPGLKGARLRTRAGYFALFKEPESAPSTR